MTAVRMPPANTTRRLTTRPQNNTRQQRPAATAAARSVAGTWSRCMRRSKTLESTIRKTTARPARRTGSCARSSLREAASSNAPTDPTAADSVGVATPSRIDPNTVRIKIAGGPSTPITCRTRAVSPAARSTTGQARGQTIPTTSTQSM